MNEEDSSITSTPGLSKIFQRLEFIVPKSVPRVSFAILRAAQLSASASAAAASAHMPPKQKGKSGPKKKGAKDGPVKLDDKDLLRRAEIDIACLQSLLEVKSQEVCTFGTSA